MGGGSSMNHYIKEKQGQIQPEGTETVCLNTG
jgi:hypothetical protein